MRGDPPTENEVPEEAAAAASGERRASIVSLQNMLRKVSQSPFHHQYDSLVPSTSDSSDSSLTKSGSKQDGDGILNDRSAAAAHVTNYRRPQNGLSMGDKHLLSSAAEDGGSDSLFLSPQNDVSGGVSVTNPFYDYYLESGRKSTDTEGRGRADDVNPENIFVPPPDFQSSPLDLRQDSETVERGATFEPEPDLFHMFVRERLRDPSQTKSAPNVSADGRYHDVTLNSPDVFETPQTQSAAENARSKDVFQRRAGGIFQAAEDVTPVDASVSGSVNPFYSASTKKTHLFQAAPDNDTEQEQDLFGGSSLKEHLDVLSPSSSNAFDPFPSPIARDLFQDFSRVNDPFCEATSKHDPLRNVSNGPPDIFQPLPSDNGGGVLQTTSDATHAAPSPRTPSRNQLDTLSSQELFKASESPSAIKRKSSGPVGITLSTPQGTKHNILQPTPFSQARSLSASPSDSPSDVQTFKRPPKPLPRTRPPRPRKPPKAATPTEPDGGAPKTSPKPTLRPLPKPVVRLRPKTPESKPVDPQNYVVFEDILLIGQERCVEDWPEDSPQLDPAFKPSGKFRLRRESLKMKAESDGGSGEDQDESGSRGKRKDKKFRVSVLSRRGSKDKSPDDTKENRSRTLPATGKSSKDYFSETSPREIEDREQSGMDYKKKPLKTKVNQLLRRASSTFPISEGKQTRQSPQESKEGAVRKKTVDKQDPRRWSEGDVLDKSSGEEEGGGGGGQAQHEERGKKKMKIKFVPHRGFAIALEKEAKGACGYTPRKDSKDMSDDPYPKKSSFSADDLDDEGLSETEDCKPKKIKHKGPVPLPPKPKKSQEATRPNEIGSRHGTPQQTCSAAFAEDEMTPSGKDLRDMYDSEQDEDICKSQKKTLKVKGFKTHKAKSKRGSVEDPPGATCSDYLSEAAQAEWLAAQNDERAMACLEDGDGDGDTDSLMEWWNTVEQWDELPSDEENGILQEDESKSFTVLANKVHRGLRVFNKVFTERAEVLWQYVITLHAIADNINEVHHKAKIAGITGGTTTAVGGVTAIAGLVMAPFTLGVSLIVTAVGVGVATAGGITSASATISDNVNNMQDSKKVEAVLQEYEDHLLHIAKILHFVNQGLYKLRGHPFLRSGTQHYSEEWEIRRAVQMISLVDSPVMRATEIADAAVFSVQGLFRGMDKYFMKESRELKKGCKKELVGQIKAVANGLNEGIVELNAIREELQDATGQF